MILLWFKKVWGWLKKNWKYVLFPIGILIGLVTLLGRRKINVVAPELLGAEETRREADEKAAEQLEEAREERRKKTEEIEKEHADTVAKLTNEQRGRLDELRDDPDELNSFLLSVGEDVRDP